MLNSIYFFFKYVATFSFSLVDKRSGNFEIVNHRCWIITRSQSLVDNSIQDICVKKNDTVYTRRFLVDKFEKSVAFVNQFKTSETHYYNLTNLFRKKLALIRIIA